MLILIYTGFVPKPIVSYALLYGKSSLDVERIFKPMSMIEN